MAYISEVTPMAIAYKSNDLVDGRVNTAVECSTANNPDELWTSVKDAITHAPTLQVAYDESIDLKRYWPPIMIGTLKQRIKVHINLALRCRSQIRFEV